MLSRQSRRQESQLNGFWAKSQAIIAARYSTSAGRAHPAAIKNFDKALEIDPRSADSLIHRGRSYVALGRREQALADFDAAIRLSPSAEAFIHRSGARMNWGLLSLALATLMNR